MDEVTNSCSNITASTYCNDTIINSGKVNDVRKSSSGDQKPLYEPRRDSLYSDLSSTRYTSRDLLSECENLSVRRESTSTYERDMEIIDLLERERSMDIQDMLERERRAEASRNKQVKMNQRKNSATERHRKLPDITKIAATPSSPKRIAVESGANFPNFVFTHQHQQGYPAEQRSNRVRSTAPVGPSANRNRQSSVTSGTFVKRNSGPQDLMNVDEQLVPSSTGRMSRTRSTGSSRSSTKSAREQRIVSGEYRENVFTENL